VIDTDLNNTLEDFEDFEEVDFGAAWVAGVE
jgi:hypothetical protein